MAPFAFKILKAALKGKGSKAATRRFMQEAEAASRVSDPHVVTIMDFGVSEEQHVPYIVMEYIEGHTLKTLIDREDLTLTDKLSIISQVAEALDAIHAVGICHRDVKPGNIMIDRDMNVKMTDFGIAKLPESDLTNADNLMGTLPYMAPEAFFSSDIDYRADFFSLGVLAYEMLCGRRPFKGDSMIEIGNNICKLRPTEPRELQPAVPIEAQQLIATLLKKRPEHRFQRGSEIVAELDPHFRQNRALDAIKRLLKPRPALISWNDDSELGQSVEERRPNTPR
jgi:serine/threonine protein kinase